MDEPAPPGDTSGWIAAGAITVATFGVLAGAAVVTPGDPLTCQIPNPSAWWLCPWLRSFVVRALLFGAVVVGAVLVLATVVGIVRGVARAGR